MIKIEDHNLWQNPHQWKYVKIIQWSVILPIIIPMIFPFMIITIIFLRITYDCYDYYYYW